VLPPLRPQIVRTAAHVLSRGDRGVTHPPDMMRDFVRLGDRTRCPRCRGRPRTPPGHVDDRLRDCYTVRCEAVARAFDVISDEYHARPSLVPVVHKRLRVQQRRTVSAWWSDLEPSNGVRHRALGLQLETDSISPEAQSILLVRDVHSDCPNVGDHPRLPFDVHIADPGGTGRAISAGRRWTRTLRQPRKYLGVTPTGKAVVFDVIDIVAVRDREDARVLVRR
jgi:hypothetical protein